VPLAVLGWGAHVLARRTQWSNKITMVIMIMVRAIPHWVLMTLFNAQSTQRKKYLQNTAEKKDF
jgi:ABC-type dipeptide/oligopeptide/nickel transport system permease component